MKKKKTLLAIFAHPDDEAFGTGGTLSKYAAEGVDVHLITATCGEAGQIADPEIPEPKNLCEVRAHELQLACQAYGMNPPHLLYYPDGKTTVVNQKEAVGKVVKLIRQIKPDVVMTHGLEGVYGHYDHLAVHRWASIALELASDPAWFPEQLEAGLTPHSVSKVYHRALPQAQIDHMRADGGGYVMMDGVPFPFMGYPEEEITTLIDVTAYAAQKADGILCHATQVQDKQFFRDPDGARAQAWFTAETYIRVSSAVPVAESPETDFFAGLE